MKRSEMVRIIEVQFMKRLGTHNFNTKDIAEKVLDRIEQSGMLPPAYTDNCCPQEFKGTNLEPFYVSSDINEWEPEDE